LDDEIDIYVRVNGHAHAERVSPRLHAADFLRQVLGLTGTHVGCEQGACGMCTVLVDGQAVKSCLMLAVQLDGCEVATVESLADEDRLSPLQEAFREEHGLQCGFCTPGFLMTATALSNQGRRLSREDLRDELAGVLCRCTGYEGVVRAVERHLNAEVEPHD
jgi:aerobic-type carbon monoxide dehydrogenase small subunit (CoxS/CutS family)